MNLDAILRDDSVPLEDLIELIWPNEPLPFDPVGKLSPDERRLGFCLREAGFAPIHIAKLEDDPFGRWEFRIRFDPDHEQPKGRRGLRKRLQNAVLDADLRPIADEVTKWWDAPEFADFNSVHAFQPRTRSMRQTRPRLRRTSNEPRWCPLSGMADEPRF